MPEFIERTVRGMRASSSSEVVTLLVGCDGDRDELAEDIRSYGTVDGLVGSTTIKVSLPESEVDRLCKTESVISVEPDDQDVSILGDENFGHQTGSMM